MAPTYRHGQSAAVFCDEKDLSKFLREATISASMDPAEVTNFGSGCDREYVKGPRTNTVSCDGLFAAATSAIGFSTNDIANYMDAHFAGSSQQVVTICPEGASTGRRAYLFKSDITTWDISAPVADVISASVDFNCAGTPGWAPGKLLAYKVSAATGSGGTVAYQGSTTVGGSTGGGLAHLHVVSETAVTTATFKVQHSTSGSTWADLTTFTAATGITFQRSTVAGTIKEKLRATCSAFTGTSLTWAVAFSRNGSPKM